jgi:hypothetical protein
MYPLLPEYNGRLRYGKEIDGDVYTYCLLIESTG